MRDVAAVISVVGRRDDVEGEAETLSFDVVRPRRIRLCGVAAQKFLVALSPPLPALLVPGNAVESGAYTRPIVQLNMSSFSGICWLESVCQGQKRLKLS